VIGDQHISFTTSKIGSLVDVNQSKWVRQLFEANNSDLTA